ncbi:GNAT family protein [Nocardiopsis sp. ATB16-24]|uniref:GNAT family N-acetyltransferase n=1 Tax=Nocardiopsis sp. ATB16-24 TaxID=3019555 RepID=UPI0025562D0C|nr:GNAT family protein [Nocardiopsis sp. ATB16-24]
MNEPHLLLTGPELALGMPRKEMLRTYHAWENDAGTLLGFGNQVPQSWETREAGWERQRGNMNFPQFEVVRIHDHAPIGMTTLEINRFTRSAEFVMVLAPEERGKGHAAEAARLTLNWAFHVAALRTVWLKVLAPNTAGTRAYEKAGFRHAGRLRRAGFWMGRPVDELLMDALPEDFPWPSVLTGTSSEGLQNT